jgi:hypothetical protein
VAVSAAANRTRWLTTDPSRDRALQELRCRRFGLSAAQPQVAATCWLLDVPESIAAQGRREPDGVGLGSSTPAAASWCISEPRVTAYAEHPVSSPPTPCGGPLGVGTEVAAGYVRTDIVHSHTSYANLARAGRPLLHGVTPSRRRTTWSAGGWSAARHRDYATQRLPNLDVAGVMGGDVGHGKAVREITV